jgi:hypothetical protein
MTPAIELAGEIFFVEARHRLALAVTAVDSVTTAPLRTSVRIGREVRRGPGRALRRGDVLDPLASRLDAPLERRGTTASILLHRLDVPLPPAGGPPVTEVVIRLDDPSRRHVPRRLRVPVWTRRRVEEPESDPGVPPITAATRTVSPWLLPGSAYDPPPGTTGVRGRLLDQQNNGVAWHRVRALGPAGEILGGAHGDDRGEFLLVVTTTGGLPPPPPSTLPLRLRFWVPPVLDPSTPEPPGQRLAPNDPLGDLVIEDAVDRSAGAAPGSVKTQVLRGEAIPDGHLLAAIQLRPPEALSVGRLVEPDPFVLA